MSGLDGQVSISGIDSQARRWAPPDGVMSPETILLDGQRVDYQLKRTSRRTIGFSVSENGLSVSAPRFVSSRDIEEALARKSGWILSKLAIWSERPRTRVLHLVTGEQLPWRGGELTLEIVEAGVRSRVHLDDDRLVVRIDPHLVGSLRQKTLGNAITRFYRREAQALMEPLVHAYAERLGRVCRKVSVRDQKSRWGSCASDGTIRLNWRLIGFPDSVSDYVCAHEAAHLRHPDHSRQFWNCVEEIFPGWRVQRDYLRSKPNGHLFNFASDA